MPGNALDDNVQANDDEEQTSDRWFSDILQDYRLQSIEESYFT